MQPAAAAVPRGCCPAGASPLDTPAVLHFEAFWQQHLDSRGSARRHRISIEYHTATLPAAFFVRGTLSTSNNRDTSCSTSRRSGSRDSRRVAGTAGTSAAATVGPRGTTSITSSSSSSQGCRAQDAPPQLPREGGWLAVTGASGQALEQWDLHVGAELSLLGRQVTVRKASCATMAWLDAWAKLLLGHKACLEEQLAAFTPVIAAEGLVTHTRQRGEWGAPGQPPAPSGGMVNLRHLREDVALLASRLRQHKADVRLPPQLQELVPQGPHDWCLEAVTPVQCPPFTPTTPKHATGQLLMRAFVARGGVNVLRRLPSLGDTPAAEAGTGNLNSLMCWINRIPLAASAASTGCQAGDSCGSSSPPCRPAMLTC